MLEKRYYWLKLKKDFFKRHDIVLVEAMPNGKDYILFYLKLLLESIEHEGELRFNDTIPYNEQMLAVITNTNVDMVKAAMKVFIGLKMVEMLDDGTIFMTETEKMIGSECSSANRVRDYREKKQALQCNNDVTKCNIDIKKETDTETNTDTETETNTDKNLMEETKEGTHTHKPNIKSNRFVKPTLEEVNTYIQENSYTFSAEQFFAYYESTGWMIGKSPMKNWKAACLTWQTRQDECGGRKKSESKMEILSRMLKDAKDDESRNNSDNNSN